MAVFCRWCNFPSEASLAVIWVDRDQESVMIVIRSDVDQMEIYVLDWCQWCQILRNRQITFVIINLQTKGSWASLLRNCLTKKPMKLDNTKTNTEPISIFYFYWTSADPLFHRHWKVIAFLEKLLPEPLLQGEKQKVYCVVSFLSQESATNNKTEKARNKFSVRQE